MSVKPSSVTIVPWLRANLGKDCLAGQTGTDQKALLAAIQILELYSYERDAGVLEAFQRVVMVMQSKQRFLVFHAIAHVMDWSDRKPIWFKAGLNPLINVPFCQFEPGVRT